MAEAPSKIGEIRGQGVSTEVHPGVAEQPIAARIVDLNAPMPLLRGPCQSSDPRLRLARKSWMREPPAYLHWRQDRVSFAAWKPCREIAVPKERMHYAKLLSNFYARLSGVDRSIPSRANHLPLLPAMRNTSNYPQNP